VIRKLFRRGLRIGAVVGAILFLVQIFLRRPAQQQGTAAAPDRQPERAPSPKREESASGQAPTPNGAEKPKTLATEAPPWVDPEEGACPVSHPVKVKLASGIFHVPGGLAYDRTTPDRCYRDTAAAETDGFRPSKR
jgi:hypothetical protein